MRTASAALNAHFLSATQTFAFDCYTITLQSGAVLRWTDADVPLATDDGRLFSCGPLITRDRISWRRGVEVDELAVTFSGGSAFSINGSSLPAFATAGGLDNARVVLERLYLDTALATKGQLELFSGDVADINEITQTSVDLVVKSDLARLDVQMPRNVWQSSCRNDLFDVRCCVNRAAYTVPLVVSAVDPNNARTIFQANYGGKPAGWFALGILRMTSGQNLGHTRTVKIHEVIGGTVTAFTLARGFPFPVKVNDMLVVEAGCDKTLATCVGKFDDGQRLRRFRAEPFIPNPETVT